MGGRKVAWSLWQGWASALPLVGRQLPPIVVPTGAAPRRAADAMLRCLPASHRPRNSPRYQGRPITTVPLLCQELSAQVARHRQLLRDVEAITRDGRLVKWDRTRKGFSLTMEGANGPFEVVVSNIATCVGLRWRAGQFLGAPGRSIVCVSPLRATLLMFNCAIGTPTPT